MYTPELEDKAPSSSGVILEYQDIKIQLEFPKAAVILRAKGVLFQVIHLTGKGGSSSYEGVRAVVKVFESDMALAYAAADVAVCRSGAGTIAELIRYRTPALLIPYPYAADDHQRINGTFLAKEAKGARMVVQTEASPERMAEEIAQLIQEKEKVRSALEQAGVKLQRETNFGTVVREEGRKR